MYIYIYAIYIYNLLPLEHYSTETVRTGKPLKIKPVICSILKGTDDRISKFLDYIRLRKEDDAQSPRIL